MLKLLLSLTFFLSILVGKSQLTDQEKKDLYPEKYTFEHYDKFMNEATYDKAMWILINLYTENKEQVIEKVKIIQKKIDTTDLRMFIVSSFSTYALFDPNVVNWDKGMPEINNEKMNLKGSWGDAIIAAFYPPDYSSQPVIPFLTRKGILIAFNFENSKFTIRIEGDKIQPTDEFLIFIAENRTLQLTSNEVTLFPGLDKCKNLRDSLTVYMNNELEYYGNMMQKKVKAESSEMIKIGKQNFLFWSYILPEEFNADLDRQYFLTTIAGDHIFAIATAENKSVKPKEIKKYMSNYASTLKIYGNEMDIQQIQNELKNE